MRVGFNLEIINGTCGELSTILYTAYMLVNYRQAKLFARETNEM